MAFEWGNYLTTEEREGLKSPDKQREGSKSPDLGERCCPCSPTNSLALMVAS